MKSLDVINDLCERCIIEGESVIKTEWKQERHIGNRVTVKIFYDLEKFIKWKANCNVLMTLLDKHAKPWSDMIKDDFINDNISVLNMLGTIKSIKETIGNNLLITIEEIIFAEAFSNLIEQAENLFSQNYFLASGILCRAVMEEKLRNLTAQNNIVISKNHPTMSDYNNELYKNSSYDKITFKNIDYLTSIGNNAAHNQAVSKDDIEKLLNGVKELLIKLS